MGRSELKELSAHEFAQIVKNQAVYKLRGGGLDDINIFRSKKRYIQGSGLLSSFANLSKFLLPAIKRYVLPAAGSRGVKILFPTCPGCPQELCGPLKLQVKLPS